MTHRYPQLPVKAIKVTSASMHNLSTHTQKKKKKKRASVHKNKTESVKALKQTSHRASKSIKANKPLKFQK
jgi:hypothetical protein